MEALFSPCICRLASVREKNIRILFHVQKCEDAMKEGKLQIYCGSGKGKTTAAIGLAIREASRGRSVFVVQFLKGKHPEDRRKKY